MDTLSEPFTHTVRCPACALTIEVRYIRRTDTGLQVVDAHCPNADQAEHSSPTFLRQITAALKADTESTELEPVEALKQVGQPRGLPR